MVIALIALIAVLRLEPSRRDATGGVAGEVSVG